VTSPPLDRIGRTARSRGLLTNPPRKDESMPRATTNQAGIRWATSRSGRLDIAVGPKGGQWQVWALYAGSHDLAPRTRNFPTEPRANTYANHLWATA
jgi:hypothetical protein